MIPALILLAASSAASDTDDAARVEQLIQHHTAPPASAAAPAKPSARNAKTAAAPDAAAALIGQRVRVRTVDRGAYVGTLQSVDANSVVLRIDLAHQPLDYSLPRHGVEELAAETAP